MLARSIWATGQDQCATIKRVLAVMLPGVSVFLDVRPNTCMYLPLMPHVLFLCQLCIRHSGAACCSRR
jgi:hypothetical protein